MACDGLQFTLKGDDMRRIFTLGLMTILAWAGTAAAQDRPNILWLCGEDLGAHLSMYGDQYPDTPHIEKLADQSLTYNLAWSNAPVCAPARTTLATGMYATSLGGQHMRSWVAHPPGAKMYQHALQEAGYTTVKHGKEDFNVPRTGKLWTSNKHADQASQPFFIKENFGRLHESRVGHGSAQIEGPIPEDITVPPFHPDIAEARRNWATYYQRIREFDTWVGQQIERLKEAGRWQNTIVVLWGDHGPGLPFGKRFTTNFGLQVPLIVYVPKKFRDELAPADYTPGGHTDRPVSFVDFGPTMLSLAGIEPPAIMQGKAFMGEYEAKPRQYVFGFRGRMDERLDMTRTVRDQRYQLIRNYMPHRRYGQYVQYLHRNPTMDKWQRLFNEGQIDPPASFYWQQKPAVELYDLKNDPHGVRNLAYHPDYQDVRQRLTQALHQHQEQIRDIGFLPEAQIHSRPGEGQSPYEYAQSAEYPLKRIRAMAERAARRDMADVPKLVQGLAASDPAIRYWAATGLLLRGQDAVWPHRQQLRQTMQSDKAPTARVVAAESLARYSNTADRKKALQTLLKLGHPRSDQTNQFTAIAALNAVDKLDALAMPIYQQLKALPKQPKNGPKRAEKYTQRLLTKILRDLHAMRQSSEQPTDG
jgi:uncharacterized sulfatase